MKKILLLTSAIALLTTTGCIVRGDRGHAEYHEERPVHVERHEDVVVAPPDVVVRPPEVIVR